MGYKYELHLHTSEVSRCAGCPAANQVEIYRRLGYTGICVTDHFFGGSNNIPPDVSWEEKIHRLASGYENAKKPPKARSWMCFSAGSIPWAAARIF